MLISLCFLLALAAAAQDAAVLLSHEASKDVEPNADPDAVFWKGIKGVLIDKTILGVLANDRPQRRLFAEGRCDASDLASGDEQVIFLTNSALENTQLQSLMSQKLNIGVADFGFGAESIPIWHGEIIRPPKFTL